MAKFPCRVRKLRKVAQLSQRELAHLIGLQSQGVMSEIESGLKRPSLVVALASSLILGETIAELYPGIRVRAQRIALTGALRLRAHLEGTDRRADTFDYLDAAVHRLRGSRFRL